MNHGKQALLILIAVVWVGLTLFAVVQTILSIGIPSEMSGWWQVAIEMIGLPLLLFGLYQIIQQNQRQPDIHVGVYHRDIRTVDIYQLDENDELQSEYKVSGSNTDFALTIQNRGRKVAQFIKIRLEHLNRIESPTSSRIGLSNEVFSSNTNVDFHFDDQGYILYPGEIQSFIFKAYVQERNRLTDPIRGETAHLRCTIWADGLDKPIQRELFISGVGSNKET